MRTPPVPNALSALNAGGLSPADVAALVQRACPPHGYRGARLLLIVPDGTRTAPIGDFFQALHAQLGEVAAAFDVLVALGTHPPMTEAAIGARLGLTPLERATTYQRVRFFNHAWDRRADLREVGRLGVREVEELSEGRLSLEVPVTINARVFDYDQLIIIGPVFPHEVVGFSGGNKYLFPGISGPEILHFFHWLGALVTNPLIIGRPHTAVRGVVDRAGAMVRVPKLCFALVVDSGGRLAGAHAGTPEEAWELASGQSASLNIDTFDRPFHTVLSCAPPMYTELWTAGKCMYKLEPVVADGGELILYAPHLTTLSATHGETIVRLGYHCRDYFLHHWEAFRHEAWGVLAHLTHLYGTGTYDARAAAERPRIQVTLATGLSPATCRQVNLGYRDWRTIDVEAFAHREADGVLLVRRAGERLHRLRD